MSQDTHLFIADLHLDPQNLRTLDLARRFVKQAQAAKHLYLLGDLFEYWVGDDAGIPLYASFIDALRKLSESGCSVTVMLGNRDFLLGERFAEQCGATLITADERVITLGDTRVLLMHGDTLCTDDVDYQQFRSKLRSAQWRQQFLRKTVEERKYQAEALRAASHDASVVKRADVMDININTVKARLQANNCHTLIHGHTHRPAIHTIPADSTQDSAAARRLVVGDWHPHEAKYVLWDGAELSLQRFT